MFGIVIFALLIGSIIWVIWQLLFSVHVPLNTVNFFEGMLGGGKTVRVADIIIKKYRQGKLCKFLSKFIIPIWPLNKLKKKLRDLDYTDRIYTTFPLRLSKRGKTKVVNYLTGEITYVKGIWSRRLTTSHVLWKLPLPDNCLLGVDEMGFLFPSEAKKADPRIVWCFALMRHAFDPLFVGASQSLSQVSKEFRSKVNTIYSLSNFEKHLFGLCYTCDVDRIVYNELVTNIQNIKSIKESNAHIFGIFGRKHFDSRYMREFYHLDLEIQDRFIKNWTDYSREILGNESHWSDFIIHPSEELIKKIEYEKKEKEKMLSEEEV